jgi:O-succinylbenzoic acid--CoA ligase
VPALEHVHPAGGDLVAVTLPPSLAWLDLVSEIWDAGAALLPIDERLPAPRRAELIERAGPTVLLDETGARRREGEPVESGITLAVHSSGTGGAPAFAQFDRGAIEAAVSSSSLALGATGADRWLCCLPLAHVGGLLVLLRALVLGAPVAVHDRFDASAVLAEADVAFVSVVPTMLARLVETGADLSMFRSILVGGAHLPADLRSRAERAGARVVETYGMTESCGGVVYDGLPLRGTEVRIATEGEIQLRGPTVMRGYRLGETPSFGSDGWLRTADAGEFDANGRLHVAGRRDEVVVTGGEKVWPQAVEAALQAHPRVREVAAAGVPDPEWGERVTVWVVPTDTTKPPTLDDLRAFVAEALPRYAAPRELVLVERLPRTASGKVRRADLPRD